MDRIPICAHYELDGQRIDYFPFPAVLSTPSPSWSTCPVGSGISPAAAPGRSCPRRPGDYVEFVEKQIGCHITYVSVGPERDSIIIR